jgi:hypothetical protein
MADLAAHLVDAVLPKVAIRQWVCSLPWRLRYLMAYDRELCADVLEAFIGALRRSLRRRAKRALGLRSLGDLQIGAVTFVQRCDSSLRLNVHFHTLADAAARPRRLVPRELRRLTAHPWRRVRDARSAARPRPSVARPWPPAAFGGGSGSL